MSESIIMFPMNIHYSSIISTIFLGCGSVHFQHAMIKNQYKSIHWPLCRLLPGIFVIYDGLWIVLQATSEKGQAAHEDFIFGGKPW